MGMLIYSGNILLLKNVVESHPLVSRLGERSSYLPKIYRLTSAWSQCEICIHNRHRLHLFNPDEFFHENTLARAQPTVTQLFSPLTAQASQHQDQRQQLKPKRAILGNEYLGRL